MIIKCMLPISLVEKEGFKQYVEFLDPSFRIPTRWKIKESGLPELIKEVNDKIKLVISNLSSCNISQDGWTDPLTRCFTGSLLQGIDYFIG